MIKKRERKTRKKKITKSQWKIIKKMIIIIAILTLIAG